MAKRSFGTNIDSSSARTESNVANKKSNVSSSRAKSSKSKPKKKRKGILGFLLDDSHFKVVLVVFIVLILSVSGLVAWGIYSGVYDKGRGSAAPEDSISDFVGAVFSDDNQAVYDFIPPGIRNSGRLVDDFGISKLRSIYEEGYVTTYLTIDEVDTSVSATDVSGQIRDLYGVSVGVNDAVVLSVHVEFSDLVPSLGASYYDFRVYSVRCRERWYIIPGMFYERNAGDESVLDMHVGI